MALDVKGKFLWQGPGRNAGELEGRQQFSFWIDILE